MTPGTDVALAHGQQAAKCRFDDQVVVDEPLEDLLRAELVLVNARGEFSVIENLARLTAAQSTQWLTDEFASILKSKPVGNYLEVGSRARSGIVRRELAPPGWKYVGLDVMSGENVDVVGDAHELSKHFPAGGFDAVAAFSVLEHILMPWKLVIELNKVMKTGGVGLFTTHQTWPVHEAPWDFWRFSDMAWAALFNPKTGFEVVKTAMGERGYVVAERCHAVTHFGDVPSSFLASSVVFRKVSSTKLEWDVALTDAIPTFYPSGVSAVRR